MTPAGKTGPDDAWPEDLLASVRDLPSHARLFVALSGGLDSVLLLHTVTRVCRPSAELAAIHVNHQLQVNARETESFCERLCHSLAIPCRTIRVEVQSATAAEGSTTGGLEEAARIARYHAFEACLGEGDLLLMAHHGDDQAETVLFRLVRGTGVAGLGGIPRSRGLGKGLLHRPFLGFSRNHLEACARRLGVEWVEDPSNRDQRFDRNFLRQTIIPALRARWPFLNRRLAATAASCRESLELADSLANIQLEQCGTADGGLDLSQVKALTLAEQKNLIRWWVRQRRYPPPATADWPGLLAAFLESGSDRQPEYSGNGYSLRRLKGVLYLVADQVTVGEDGAAVLPQQDTVWGNWRLTLQAVAGNCGPAPDLRVFSRQGGERIRAVAGGPSKSLKNWFQEHSVPVWERDRLPLVKAVEDDGNNLIAIGNYWISAQYDGAAPASGWRLILERDSN